MAVSDIYRKPFLTWIITRCENYINLNPLLLPILQQLTTILLEIAVYMAYIVL